MHRIIETDECDCHGRLTEHLKIDLAFPKKRRIRLYYDKHKSELMIDKPVLYSNDKTYLIKRLDFLKEEMKRTSAEDKAKTSNLLVRYIVESWLFSELVFESRKESKQELFHTVANSFLRRFGTTTRDNVELDRYILVKYGLFHKRSVNGKEEFALRARENDLELNLGIFDKQKESVLARLEREFNEYLKYFDSRSRATAFIDKGVWMFTAYDASILCITVASYRLRNSSLSYQDDLLSLETLLLTSLKLLHANSIFISISDKDNQLPEGYRYPLITKANGGFGSIWNIASEILIDGVMVTTMPLSMNRMAFFMDGEGFSKDIADKAHLIANGMGVNSIIYGEKGFKIADYIHGPKYRVISCEKNCKQCNDILAPSVKISPFLDVDLEYNSSFYWTDFVIDKLNQMGKDWNILFSYTEDGKRIRMRAGILEPSPIGESMIKWASNEIRKKELDFASVSFQPISAQEMLYFSIGFTDGKSKHLSIEGANLMDIAYLIKQFSQRFRDEHIKFEIEEDLISASWGDSVYPIKKISLQYWLDKVDELLKGTLIAVRVRHPEKGILGIVDEVRLTGFFYEETRFASIIPMDEDISSDDLFISTKEVKEIFTSNGLDVSSTNNELLVTRLNEIKPSDF